MKTESQHKNGTNQPKNHPEGHFVAQKHAPITENAF